MKKIMIMACAVAIAAVAQAASVNWMSGALQTPGAEGALSGTMMNSSSGYTLSMYAFESLSSIAFEAGDLYKWYSDDTTKQFKGLDAIAGTVTMNANVTMGTAKGVIAPATDGTTIYGAVLFVLSDAETGDALWYMENTASKASAKNIGSVANLGLKVGGTGAATSWTAVPEPTSGLLMLVGLAGLALRRRRA